MTLNDTRPHPPTRTCPRSGSFRGHARNRVSSLLLVVCLCAGSAQAQFVGFLPKIDAALGYGSVLEKMDIRSECRSLANANVTITAPAQTVNVAVNAAPYQLLTPWVTLSHPGWSCMRRFTYGRSFEQIPHPECNGGFWCILERNTLLRHWLEGRMLGVSSTGQTLVDGGDTYLILTRNEWTGSHPLAGLGYIVKWEGSAKGQPLSLPIGPGIEPYLTGGLPGDINRYGPVVSIYHVSQPYLNSGAAANNYPADGQVSFRMVLIANPDSLQNSGANTFPITTDFSLGYDFCQWEDVPNCLLSQTSYFNAKADFYAAISVYHEIPSCTTPDVTVAMPMVSPSEFPGVGSKAGLKQFTLELNCKNTIRRTVSYRLTSPTTKDAAQGLIAINSGSSASGVDVQILKSSAIDDVHPLDENIVAYNWLGSGSAVQNLGIPLYAILRRFSTAPVGAGDYTAGATVVFSYN